MPHQPSLPFGGEQLPGDGSAILIPNFFAADEADELFRELLSGVPWETQELAMFGNIVPEPRQSAWISDGVTYAYSGATRTAHPWTPALSHIRDKCSHQANTRFNGVLANYYKDGNDHLGWHADDEMVNGPEPTIASVSLGAERRFDFRHNETHQVVSVLLPHGSLLIMSGLSQSCWQHRIPRETKLTLPRINLTFRKVLNLS
ncbi:MAG: alpha-ketoglutarate-dependent dioxygenase AlkB family protein [Acidimicrobiaceae bacterium]